MENRALNGIKLVNAFGRYLDAQQISRVGVLRLVQEKEKKMVSFNFLNGYDSLLLLLKNQCELGPINNGQPLELILGY